MWNILKLMVEGANASEPAPQGDGAEELERRRIGTELLGILGRALAIRQLDAGSCNGCELEIHALSNPYYNIEGLGIQFVASPRHADLLLVTGPVTRNMETALLRTYAAMPEPRLVVALGDCAQHGGIFGVSYACRGGIGGLLPVDVWVPGCPPPPLDILRGILAAVGRLKGARTPP